MSIAEIIYGNPLYRGVARLGPFTISEEKVGSDAKLQIIEPLVRNEAKNNLIWGGSAATLAILGAKYLSNRYGKIALGTLATYAGLVHVLPGVGILGYNAVETKRSS